MKTNTVLVCVTARESSKILIKTAKELAEKYNSKLEAVSVLPTAVSESEIKQIEIIHQMANENDGEMTILFNDDPVLTLIAQISKTKPRIVVTGYPGENSNNFIDSLHILLPNREIAMVDGRRIYSIIPKPESVNIKQTT